VLAAMTTLPADETTLADCRGLALAADVVAPHRVPPFANSAMDGFAVRAADVVTVPVTLDVIEDVPAGSVPERTVEPGTTIRIMTGAPMPDGADAVVIVEDSEALPDGRVSLRVAAGFGDHVRPAGGDIDAGSVVLEGGTRLDATRLGLLASVGVSQPRVVRRPTVAVLSTGDELLPVEAPALRPGAIYDSNRPMLIAMLTDLGVEVLDLGIVPDDARLLRSVLGEAAANADAVLTSGGVSMGDYDLVKQVLGEMGRIDFWRVAMQPAKPFAFGFLGDTPLFGLPGNPVSVMVAFEQFVRPALLKRMGSNLLFRPRSLVRAAEGFDTHPDKTVFVRVRVRTDAGELVVASSGVQASNVLSALAAADALAVVPVGVGSVAPGDMVGVEWFRSPESRTSEEALGG
jgi:molybdopterin molybdotransferase